MIADKELPKVNAFILHGPTNCFKSTIFRLLFDGLNITPMTRTAGNNNFYLQSCLNEDYIIIIWEEPMLTMADINEWKLLLEGAPVKASIKNGPDSLLTRTPFFITTNHSLSKWISIFHNN
uniref:Parvovirus non-structural protein 1 helicase domain-containing protein n=1 Tax=Lepeophtheirus salmonis TaxID=72036 RepID=A0A0K2VKZ4_LEPSM